MRAKIYVFLKKDVLDPQGKAVESSLQTLGFDEVKSVRVGKFFDIEIGENFKGDLNKRLKEYCKKLLVNEVIEDFKIEIL